MNGDLSVTPRPASEHLDSLIEHIGVLPLSGILRELLERSAEVMQVERVGYWSLAADGQSIRRELQYGRSGRHFETAPLELQRADFPTYFEALDQGSSLIVSDDVMEDPRLVEFPAAYFVPLGITSMLDAPVHRQGRLYGVICHEHSGKVRQWTPREVDFARYAGQWIALAVEIDQRQRTETALRESEARYRLVIDHTPTPTVVVDRSNGRFVDANESALRFYGVSRAALLAGGPADFSPSFQPDGRASAEAASEKISLALGGETPHFDWVHRVADGRDVPCLVHLARLPGEDNQRVIAAVTDRTEQWRTEEAMRRALANEREVSELRARFTSIVSHEFRTPLGIIMSAVELLRNYLERLDEARRTELFEDIHQATRRMGELMEQVLVLGQADAGKLGFKPAPLDLALFSRRLTEEVMAAASSHVPVELRLEGDLDDAVADRGLLHHILTNLLSNAAKYSPAGQPVAFLVGREDNDVVFSVKDQGIGIPLADQPRIFDAFQRAGNVDGIPGSGLGLLIAKRCADLHGGRISFVSAPGDGTLFTVRLPVFGQSPPEGLP